MFALSTEKKTAITTKKPSCVQEGQELRMSRRNIRQSVAIAFSEVAENCPSHTAATRKFLQFLKTKVILILYFESKMRLLIHDIKGVRVTGLSNARISRVEMYFCNTTM